MLRKLLFAEGRGHRSDAANVAAAPHVFAALLQLLLRHQHSAGPLRALTAAIGVEWLALGLSAIVLALGLISPAAYLVLTMRRVYEHILAWSLAKGTGLYIGYFVLIGLAVATLQVAGMIG